MSEAALTETLDTIQEETSGDKISLGDLVEALNHRGFGAMLIGPSLIVVLPTGGIPGVPTLCALLILLIAGQIVMGRKHPWIPKKLAERSFERGKFEKVVDTVRPYTKWVDRFFQKRFTFLTNDVAQNVIAVLCVVLALCMPPLEFLPFVAALPALAILLFGLSLSVRDGLLAAIGFVTVLLSIGIIPYYFF